MTVFFDNFERANGPLGGTWVAVTGVPVISAGSVQGSAMFTAYTTAVSDNHRSEASCNVVRPGNGLPSGGPLVRTNGAVGQGYALVVVSLAPGWSINITRSGSASGSALTSLALSTTPMPYFNLKLVWEDGHLSGYYNGGLVLQYDDVQFQQNTYCGLVGYANSSVVLDFQAISGASPALTAYPPVIPNYGACSTVTLTGANTSWTPGTPGAPIFTVNHGTIQSQTVIDATHVTLTYCPGDYLGTVTFTDPSTGVTFTTTVSSDPNIAPPNGGACGLDPITIAALNGAVLGGANPYFYASNTDIGIPNTIYSYAELQKGLFDFINTWGGEGGSSAGNQLTTLWKILNGGLPAPTEPSLQYDATTVQGNLRLILDAILAVRGPNANLTLQTILDRMTSGSTDLTPVLDRIGQWAGHPLWSVFDLLLYLSNDAQWTATDERSHWTQLVGDPWWNLSDVMGLTGRPLPSEIPSLNNILEWLKGVRGDTNTTLSDTHAQAFLSASTATNIMTSLNALRTSHGYTLQNILDAMPNGGVVDLSSVLTAISDLRGDTTSTVKQLKDAANALSVDGTLDLQDVINAVGGGSAGGSWGVLPLLVLLLLVLLGLPEEAAVVAGAGGVLSAGALLAILGGVADVASIFSNVYNWLRSQKLWTLQPAVPNYPGSNLVEWQEPIAFDTDGVIERQMDGARIVVDTPGKAPWAYKTGNVTRYGRLGIFAFQGDLGSRETIQPVTFLDQIATPRAIVSPWAMVIQCKPGTLGTVTPYTLKRA